MKKLVLVSLACGLLLTACDALQPHPKDDQDTLEEKQNNYSPLRQTKNNETTPIKPSNFLDRDVTILFDGQRMSIKTLILQIDEKLEQENSGLDFTTNIDAQDDNTQ